MAEQDAEAATEVAKMLVWGRNYMALRTPYLAQGVAEAINNPHGTRSSVVVDSAVLKSLFDDPVWRSVLKKYNSNMYLKQGGYHEYEITIEKFPSLNSIDFNSEIIRITAELQELIVAKRAANN